MFVESGGDESESTETNLLGHRAKDPTLEIQFQVHFKKAKSFPDLDAVRKEAVAIVFSRAHTVIGYSSTKWGKGVSKKQNAASLPRFEDLPRLLRRLNLK